MCGCKKPYFRLWISSMEESAIREGFNNLKDGREYDNLYNSALCRAKADWIIGINATRLFTSLYRKHLNIGRVQTPTLAMIAERDSKISMFRKEKYYTVEIDGGNIKAVRFPTKTKRRIYKRLATKGRPFVFPLLKRKRKQARRNCLTSQHYSAKQTEYSDIRRNRRLTMLNRFMKRS